MPVSAAFDLPRLLGSTEPEAFFRDSWEKQPFVVHRNDPDYYQGLFSRRDLDHVIAFTRPQFRDSTGLKPGASPRPNFIQGWLPDDDPFVGFYPDLPAVHHAVEQGKTLLINSMQNRWPAIATMCRNLEGFFGCPIHTYLLLTPPGAQGLAAHYDAYEIFVLQIDGTKQWRFYGVARELPLANDQAEVPRDRLGPPTKELLLQPGDLLYMPRGHVHEAFTSDRPSLHLTVGLRVYRWQDLLLQALAGAAGADVRFRESLPVGLLSTGAVTPALNDKFQELLRVFAKTANLEGAIETLSAAFLSRLTALPQDYFAGSDPDRIDLDTALERAPGTICRVIRKGDAVTLHAPGTQIDGPARIAPALQFIARVHRFTPRDLPDNLTSDAKLVLVRRLFREKLLTIVDETVRPR